MPLGTVTLETVLGGELQNRVSAFLKGCHHLALRSLDVEVYGDTVVLRGSVPTFYARQVALECVKHVPGVSRVVDRVAVSDDSPPRVPR
jgi:osmotically-inducible protein OsmY